MYPLLFKIGSVPVHTYGVLVAIGFLSSLVLASWLCKRDGINPEHILDLGFICILSGFIGARLLFVLTRWEYFAQDPASIFRVWEGGLVFFGGPLAATPFAIWYLRVKKIPIWKMMDACFPGVALAHMFGRFGCLSAGCCYGKPTGSDFGIRLYSDLVDAKLRGIPLHPTQLYEATSLFILVCALVWVHLHRKFEGEVAIIYFMAYPIIRSIIEIFRGDEIRGFVIDGILSTSQFISILVFIAGAITLSARLKKVNASRAVA
ncbi:MAG: prolipoprotein diacylglyceryl transferase [Oligoflexia bacterium]|nr:prolipoprotein diacylglyceryl transferase [Oligoflexia bacterium]